MASAQRNNDWQLWGAIKPQLSGANVVVCGISALPVFRDGCRQSVADPTSAINVSNLGSVSVIRSTFTGFQKGLYED